MYFCILQSKQERKKSYPCVSRCLGPRIHVPELPRPRVPTSPRPQVPTSHASQSPRPRPPFSDSQEKTKQLAWNLCLAEGERTELAMNIRTEDGMTNGAGNVIKVVQLHQENKPSGIVWVQFDHLDVGHKTRNENRHLYIQGIDHAWTPIKPVTVQFAVGRNKAAQVVRKQFPLRPAAAKTIHRSQGDTETKIVVNFSTRRTIPHIHYVGLSRVTTFEGLYITDLCEDKIAVHPDVEIEMER